jgi:hypothetical protein
MDEDEESSIALFEVRLPLRRQVERGAGGHGAAMGERRSGGEF